MKTIIDVRNTTLRKLATFPLSADFETEFIDFKEMNTAFIQAVSEDNPTTFDGVLSITVSLLQEADTFVPYPDSDRLLNATCNNFGWMFCCIPFRYARVKYVANSVTDGSVALYARAKRT